MNCSRCGSVLPQDAMFCPVCNEPQYPQNAGYQQPYQTQPSGPPMPGQQPQGYAYYQPEQTAPQGYTGYQQPPQAQPGYQQQPPAYQQTYATYQQGSYPPGYQQPYAYGQSAPREGNALLNAISELPRAFLDSFTRPGDVLRGIMERRDLASCAIVSGLVLVLSFLCGMVILRGIIAQLLGGLSALTGVSLASNSAALNQGVSYIAGRIAPIAGGVTTLGQLIGMLVPAATFIIYLCAICKVHFSLDLLLGFITVTTLPTVAAVLLAMLGALLSPWLSALIVLCGMAVSYTQACSLLSYVTGKPDQQLVSAKMLCIAVSLVLTLVLNTLFGTLLLSGSLSRVLTQLGNVGSLI